MAAEGNRLVTRFDNTSLHELVCRRLSAPLIHFVCRAKTHQAVRTKKTPDGSPITFHDGHWAYCPAGLATGHQWEAIPPTTREALRRLHVKDKSD